MLYYCKKCGRIVQEVYGKEKQICDYCNANLFPVPDNFLLGKTKCVFKDELKEQFTNEYIKMSPEFDQYLFEHRDEDLFNRSMENQAKLERGKAILEEQSKVPKCPSCGSSNISKIGLLNRAVSFELVGFASSKIGKTHKCNKCGSMW